MRSEYDPLFSSEPPADGPTDLDRVRERFAAAAGPYLRSPWPWLAWAALLPAAALATPWAERSYGPAGVLLLWSATILAGGAVEAGGFLRRRRGEASRPASPLARWVLRIQGNTSLVAVALSLVLLWLDAAELLPGVWLLLLGHSFYLLGGLAFPPFRAYGVVYQLAGAAALWPGAPALQLFAAAAAAGNLWMAWAIWKAGRGG